MRRSCVGFLSVAILGATVFDFPAFTEAQSTCSASSSWQCCGGEQVFNCAYGKFSHAVSQVLRGMLPREGPMHTRSWCPGISSRRDIAPHPNRTGAFDLRFKVINTRNFVRELKAETETAPGVQLAHVHSPNFPTNLLLPSSTLQRPADDAADACEY